MSFPEMPQARQNTLCIRDVRTMLTRVHHGETLCRFKLFAQPMDRAEVLHAQSHHISDSWKNRPGKNELILS